MGKTIVKQEIFKNISYEVEFPFEKFFISEILAWNMENIQASDILIKIEGNKVKMFTVENCFGKYKTNQFPKTYLPKAQSFEINWEKRTMKYGLNHEDVFNKDRGLHYQTGYIHINKRYRHEFILQWNRIKIVLKDGNKG